MAGSASETPTPHPELRSPEGWAHALRSSRRQRLASISWWLRPGRPPDAAILASLGWEAERTCWAVGHAGPTLCHGELGSNRPHQRVQISAPHAARDCRLSVLSGEGNGYPLQYFCLQNSMDRGTWPAAVHGIPKSWTRLSHFQLLPHVKHHLVIH